MTQFALFENIDPKNLPHLLQCLHAFEKTYVKGASILLEQDDVEYIGLILEGQVKMVKTDIWGHESLMAWMGVHELFGESFAMDPGAKAGTSFVAASYVRVLFLCLPAVMTSCRHACSYHAKLTRNLFALMARKNVQLMNKIEIVSKPTLREKILAFLSLEAQKQHSFTVTIPLSRQDMALYIGANRSAMSRELSRMEEDGLLECHGRRFVIKEQ